MEIIGERFWYSDLDDTQLTSIGQYRYNWSFTLNRATCKKTSIHEAPDAECSCGFWALKEGWEILAPVEIRSLFPPMKLEMHKIYKGKMQLWGKVVEHEYGYRSQYAKILYETLEAVAGRNQRDILNSITNGTDRVAREVREFVKSQQIAICLPSEANRSTVYNSVCRKLYPYVKVRTKDGDLYLINMDLYEEATKNA